MPQPWNTLDRDITPESAVLSRRRWIKRTVWAGLGLTGIGAGSWWWWKYGGSNDDVLANGRVHTPGDDLFPALLNPQYADLDRALTGEPDAARFCNFYEFSSGKEVWRYVKPFQPVPWKLEVTGLVRQHLSYDLEELLRAFPLEERNYRHRCVETWAMAVPWTGFPMVALIKKVDPLASAKFVRFVSIDRPGGGSLLQGSSNPWPYSEGLTIEEAANELAFIATGMYGHPLLKQHGAPVRLVVPWKYGFKSAKSLVRIEFTDKQPATFWNTLIPHEYGFQANVDPEVPHPRWSQAMERMLGTKEVHKTQKYNGYGKWVADLYSG
jgi:methionine sulfoxide reductase catalytic subunit